MADVYAKRVTVWCQVNRLVQSPHLAERTPEGKLYLYLDHPGAVKWSCAEHAGLCHAACWSGSDLLARTVKP